MVGKPSYEELEERVRALETEAVKRRQMEKELLKLYHAVNHSPSAIMITDADGVIEYVNAKFAEITGFSAEEVLGTNAADLGEQGRDEETEMWDTIKSGREWRGEFLNKKRNGELYWERASISSIKDRNNVITHYVKVAEDVTELKRAQNELRESQQQLYEHQKRMGILKFANDMALKLMHELRNPLVSIGGFSKRISRGHYSDEKLAEYTTIIFEQSKRLDSALKQVLLQLEAAAHQV